MSTSTGLDHAKSRISELNLSFPCGSQRQENNRAAPKADERGKLQSEVELGCGSRSSSVDAGFPRGVLVAERFIF